MIKIVDERRKESEDAVEAARVVNEKDAEAAIANAKNQKVSIEKELAADDKVLKDKQAKVEKILKKQD
jgi:hypothetical protein